VVRAARRGRRGAGPPGFAACGSGGGRARRWIGNGAEDGQAASVFARLKVPSPDGSGAVDDHGVHAFVVPLREAGGRALPGVEIKDCGYKVRCRCAPAALATGNAPMLSI
jgi:hypothetical protein